MFPSKRRKSEAFDQQAENKDDKTCKKEPEGICGDERDGYNYAEKPENAQDYGNPECDDFRRCKFHVFFSLGSERI
jgi:hypothetical protein